jgi:hypothetical protein
LAGSIGKQTFNLVEPVGNREIPRSAEPLRYARDQLNSFEVASVDSQLHCEKLILLLDWCVRWKFRRRKFIGLYRRFPNVVEVDEMVIKIPMLKR